VPVALGVLSGRRPRQAKRPLRGLVVVERYGTGVGAMLQASELAGLAGLRDLCPICQLVLGREIEVVCHRCGDSLGRYHASVAEEGPPYVTLQSIGGLMSTTRSTRSIHPDPRSEKRDNGPRSQRGLRAETWDRTTYLRKHCTCGSNEKRRADQLGAQPVTVRSDGSVVMAF